VLCFNNTPQGTLKGRLGLLEGSLSRWTKTSSF